jgi:hypothetical protein
MKKIYFTREQYLQARRDKRKADREYTRSKEKYIERVTESGCWIWMGSTWSGGYGYVRNEGKYISAHRYMYELYKGKIPDGLNCLHTCDNPSCVNPNHLFLGTQTDNMRDMIKKGRGANVKGNNNPNYKHGKFVNTDSVTWG